MKQRGELNQFAIVAIAGSAGGADALSQILPCLPADFSCPIVYIQHLKESNNSILVEVLQICTSLTVRWAQQGELLKAGGVYICPPGLSCFVHPKGAITFTRTTAASDILHGADRLFASVAASYGQRALVIVLSGGGWDGCDGICAVHASGGTVLVQDERSAFQPSMPRAAIATGCVDLVLRPKDIGPALINLVRDGHSLARLRASRSRLFERDGICVPQVQYSAIQRLLAVALKMHGTEMGNVQLVNRQTGNLVIVAQRGFGLDFLEHFAAVNNQDESACARAMRSGYPVLIPDIAADSLFSMHLDVAIAAGFRAVQSTPLITRNGALVGVLSTHFPTPRALSQGELHWLAGHRRANDLIGRFAI